MIWHGLLIAVAVAVSPVAIPFVSACCARSDCSADTERDPAPIAPVSATPVMISSVIAVMTVVGVVLAAIMARTGIGRGNGGDHRERSGSNSSNRAKVFFHLCLISSSRERRSRFSEQNASERN